MDFPGVSHAGHRPIGRCPLWQIRAIPLTAYDPGWLNDPRCWIFSITDGVFGIYIRTDVTKASQGECSTRNVRFGGTEWVPCCRGNTLPRQQRGLFLRIFWVMGLSLPFFYSNS